MDERITLQDYTISGPEACKSDEAPSALSFGETGERIKILKVPDLDEIRNDLQKVFDGGYRSIAICFLHSYAYPIHEQRVGQVARDIGFSNVTLSSEIMARIKVVPRGMTAVLDAYLTPKIKAYIQSFSEGFQNLTDVEVNFIRSDGGLSSMDEFRGFSAIMSGMLRIKKDRLASTRRYIHLILF